MFYFSDAPVRGYTIFLFLVVTFYVSGCCGGAAVAGIVIGVLLLLAAGVVIVIILLTRGQLPLPKLKAEKQRSTFANGEQLKLLLRVSPN